jgi:hypothetical protein
VTSSKWEKKKLNKDTTKCSRNFGLVILSQFTTVFHVAKLALTTLTQKLNTRQPSSPHAKRSKPVGKKTQLLSF